MYLNGDIIWCLMDVVTMKHIFTKTRNIQYIEILVLDSVQLVLNARADFMLTPPKLLVPLGSSDPEISLIIQDFHVIPNLHESQTQDMLNNV